MELIIEKTRSKTGLHRRTRRAFLVSRNGDIEEFNPTNKKTVRGTYVRGEAYQIVVPPVDRDKAIVYVDMTLNLRKRVKGKIYVYDHGGNLKLTLNYNKLKIRRSRGDRSYFWPVKFLIEKLNIPVKRVNLMTGFDLVNREDDRRYSGLTPQG